MFRIIRNLIFICVVIFPAAVYGQVPRDASDRVREEPPKNVRENLAKMRIEQEKKDFEELVKRTEEALELSNQLGAAANRNQLSAADRKKLDRLEKLVKKIRSELGAGKDDENGDESFPQTVASAITKLRTSASALFDEVKSSSRYSISVAAVQTSNMIMRLLKFIKIGK